MTDLAIVEDDPRFRTRFEALLASAPDMRVVASAGNVRDALALLTRARPDVLLVDLGLPDGSGIDVIGAARQRLPECEIMVISVFGDQKNVLASIEAGATGYLLKDAPNENYLARIRDLRAGGSPISPSIARQMLRRFVAAAPADATAMAPAAAAVPALPEREREVLNLLSRGFSYQEIARILDVSPHTIGTYVKRLYQRLQVNSRSEAVFEAKRRGLFANGA
jgi:DNA-binding NarL/FixJ family response regulator